MEDQVFPLVLALILGWSIPAAIIIIAIILQYKKRKRYYESLTKALELGKSSAEIKEIFSIEKQPKERNGTGFLKGGIIVAGIGIAFFALGVIIGEIGLFASSAFILILGLTLIVVYLFIRKQKAKTK